MVNHIDLGCSLHDALDDAAVAHRLMDSLFEMDMGKPVVISEQDAGLLLHAANRVVRSIRSTVALHHGITSASTSQQEA